ncbi:unnamed protein product [Trifolium pratense]|uniref:Uncharacterized protein n=1 Tax=Trifolium pratense TaxID=57577 RepID=A0ACB0IT07_TRIPR|nr:unnamed protein product [Trifolium pratense]
MSLLQKKKRRLSACSPAKKNGNITNFFVVPPRVKQEEVSFSLDQANSNYSQNVTADSVAPSVKQDKASYCAYNAKSIDCVDSSAEKVTPPQENNSLVGFPTQEIKKSAEPLSNPGSFICREGVSEANSSGTKEQHQEPKPWTMIHLNLPVSPEADVDEPFVNEMTEIQKSETGKESGE